MRKLASIRKIDSIAPIEVANMMGFTPVEKYRQPNMRVKQKMMKVLGWTYD
jgi:hypothetical protein